MSKKLVPFLLFFYSCYAFAQTDTAAGKKPRPMTWKDVSSWRYIDPANTTLSPDGKWVAYPMLTYEGDGELVLKKIKDTLEKKYPIGGAGFASLAFSEDGKWVAFKEFPAFKEAKAAAKTPEKQLFEKLVLIELATGKKTLFERAGHFAFNGKASSHLALALVKEKVPGAKPDDPKSSDLLIVELASGKIQYIGNVGEFAFNKPGTFLAYTIEAASKTGNGLYLFSTLSRQTTVLDNDKMVYKSLGWKEEGDAFAVLKMNKEEKYKTEKGIVIGVKDLDKSAAVFLYDPVGDSLSFPKGMTISGSRQPSWSGDLSRLFFGIHELKPEKKKSATADSSGKSTTKMDSVKTKPGLKTAPGSDSTVKPDMTIWNWQDKRLQSRQQVEETEDKDFSYLGMYDATAAKFFQLSDSNLRVLTLLPKQRYALGEDISPFELDMNLDGQTYTDLWLVDLKTGRRTKWMEKFYSPSFASAPRASPDGKKLLYGLDGNYYVYDIDEKTTVNITEKVPTSFINTEDDHNVKKPLTRVIGWSRDNKFVLVRDLWDIWQIPVDGKEIAVNLTQTGRQTKTRYLFRYMLDPEENEKGIDLSKPLYVAQYGEWTKKNGIGRIEPGRNGLKAGIDPLVWEDVSISSLNKAKNTEVYMFSRETFNQSPEYFVADARLQKEDQVTHNTPDANKYIWSAGTQLVNYVSDKGDSLQGALFLPAGYEKGKKYPTIVYYYEKLSQTLHNYPNPSYSRTGWNPSLYTSNGYAVFIPDIVYRIDDPGMSAVWCVIPGVKAAIATGVIDEKNIGIHGHSWGGYQTAFLVTQTNMFKAAAAGAALTDLISMYDLIYWNAGISNMSIFEASQGRFAGGPWENWESYQRNSPIYHVKNVKTPLLMLHNDKDGAVDFTQGIEFFNALRRLKKPVVMIQYKGENHGLAKPENRRDYSVRMMEFFDTYLKGKPAPDWLSKGIDRLKMEDHLDSRTLEVKEPAAEDR
jgi:dienelactone hydrolase